MSLANPWALILLSLIPIISLLHTRRMERRSVRVSALFLWEEVLREQSTVTGLKKLNLNLLLWLQMAAVAALALGLAKPHLFTTGMPAGRVVLIMDVSASMRTLEKGEEKFTAAKKAAHDLIRRLPIGGEMMVLEAGAQARVRSHFTDKKTELHDIVESMKATDEPGRLHAALNLGLSFLPGRGTVYFITDTGGTGRSFDPPEKAGRKVKPIIVGGIGKNMGITRMALRKNERGSGGRQLLVRVQNFTDRRTETGLTINLNGSPMNRRRLVLEADSTNTSIFPLPASWTGETLATLNVDDDLAADNNAYAVTSPSLDLRVLLVTGGNFFLENALSAHPGISVTRIAEVDERLLDELMAEHDIAVFDGIPGPKLHTGSYLVMGTSVKEPAIEVKGFPPLPRAYLAIPGHPLLEHLEGEWLRVGKVFKAKLPGGGEFVLGRKEAPLIYSYSSQSLRLVYFGFRLKDSDLALTPAFPILLANTIKWLQPETGAGGNRQVLTGDSYRADFGPRAEEAVIDGPWGKFTVPLHEGRLQFRRVRRAGFYKVRAGGKEHRFAANLFDEKESDPRPGVDGPKSTSSGAFLKGKREALNPVWRYLLLSALAFVALETFLLTRKTGL